MLTVKIQNGELNEVGDTLLERTFYVNDLQDLRRVYDNILDDFQKVIAQEQDEKRIEVERLLDNSPFDSISELSDWVQDAVSELDRRGYDNVEDAMDRLEQLESAIEDIYYTANDAR